MRRVLSDTWTIFTQAVKEQEEPSQRLLSMFIFFVVAAVIVFAAAGICFGFVKGVLEIIGNIITTSVLGEASEVIK